MSDRLQKIISRAGIASRRVAETLILEGRVTVNGRVATLGDKADPSTDHIKVKGQLIPCENRKETLLFYKPRGVLTTQAPDEDRPTVGEFFENHPLRLFPVGRLDLDSEGLLLMTNDGDLANLLMHPKSGIPKRYRVKTKGVPGERALMLLRKGVRLEDGRTAPATVELEETTRTNAWFTVILTEGRYRQIRRMFDHIHHSVVKLKRVGYAFLGAGKLQPGEWRVLTPREIERLSALARGEQVPPPVGRPDLDTFVPVERGRDRPDAGPSKGRTRRRQTEPEPVEDALPEPQDWHSEGAAATRPAPRQRSGLPPRHVTGRDERPRTPRKEDRRTDSRGRDNQRGSFRRDDRRTDSRGRDDKRGSFRRDDSRTDSRGRDDKRGSFRRDDRRTDSRGRDDKRGSFRRDDSRTDSRGRDDKRGSFRRDDSRTDSRGRDDKRGSFRRDDRRTDSRGRDDKRGSFRRDDSRTDSRGRDDKRGSFRRDDSRTDSRGRNDQRSAAPRGGRTTGSADKRSDNRRSGTRGAGRTTGTRRGPKRDTTKGPRK